MGKSIEKKKKKVIDAYLLQELGIDEANLKVLKKKLVKAEGNPERGIETWFRLASKNMYTRLQIVDTKANILITANAIILSVVLGTLYVRLEDDPHLIFAIAGLVLTNLGSISYAILATIPRHWNSFADSQEGNVEDLLTFDDIHSKTLQEYQEAVTKVIEEKKTLYPSIITDVHRLAKILARKYKLITVSYLILLYGISISMVLFGLCHLVGF